MFAISLLLFAIAIYAGLHSYLAWTLRNSLRADAVSIAEKLIEEATVRGNTFLVGEINEGFAPEVNSKFIRVSASDGATIYTSRPPADGSFDPAHISEVPVPAWLNAKAAFAREERASAGKAITIYSLPYTSHGGQKFLVEVGTNFKQIRSTMDGLLLLFAIGLPSMVLLAFVGGYSVVGRALQPVRTITNKAESISLASAGQRLPIIHTGDEIEQLSRALNRMLERLEEAFQHIHRFSADVSHELRTPLTIMQGELEAFLRKSQSQAQDMEMAGSCLEEVDRLARIVDQLSVLSRLDRGDDNLPKEELDFGELAKSIAEQMHLLTEEKGQTLSLRLQPRVFVEANPSRLGQVVVNLLANAIKYTPNAGTIRLSVESSGGMAVLEASDSGVGIPADALPHVFDRFFRADRARSRDTGGAGLGLSIVKAIATAYGGNVSICSDEGTGTRVRFEIPCFKSADMGAGSAIQRTKGVESDLPVR